jgi:hypothetical protein
MCLFLLMLIDCGLSWSQVSVFYWQRSPNEKALQIRGRQAC